MDDKWKQFGSTLIDAINIFYIYLLILCLAAVITAVVVISYVKKARQQKKDGITDDKTGRKNTLHRISIFVLIGALILLASPIFMGFFLH